MNWQTATELQQEIPRAEWAPFFDRFSLQHENWLVNVFTRVNERDELVARELPLQSIAASLKSGEADTISIILANARSDMLSHNVANVQNVYLLRTPGGAHEGLILRSADGTETVIKFRSPVLPETVDGVMDGNG